MIKFMNRHKTPLSISQKNSVQLLHDNIITYILNILFVIY